MTAKGIPLLAAVLIGCGARSPATAGKEDEAALRGIVAEMLAAIAPGKWEVWDRHLDESMLYTDENGKTLTKADLHKEFTPLPPGFSGYLEIAHLQARVSGDTAIVVHEDLEHETVFGQKLEARYLTTNTFLRRGGRWRLVAAQVHAILADPPVGRSDARTLDACVGVYELSPTVRYAVTREGDRLFGQRSGRPRQELRPETDGVFFIAGAPRSRKIFPRGPGGEVVAMLDRRDGRDLVWKRLPAATP
jgi:hypothetical protein